MSKAFPTLSPVRLHSYIRPSMDITVRATLWFAQRGPSVQSITRISIVIGLAPLQDSPVPTVSLFTTTTGKPAALPVAAEAPLMTPHRPADPHQLVGQRHGRLAGGAVDQQGAHIDVALPADVFQLAGIATAVLAGRHAQPGAQLAATGKALGLADRRFQGAGTQQTDAADFVEPAHDGVVGMPAGELLLALDHALLVQVDLRQDDLQLAAPGRHFGLLNQFIGCMEEGSYRRRRLKAHLAEDAAQQVDALGAALLPSFAQAVQLLQLLLLMALHRHRMNAGAARRFEEGVAVVAVGLVASPVGFHVARMQQDHPMPQRLGEASPVVRRATGFHQPLDRFRLLLYIPAKCLATQPSALIHVAGGRSRQPGKRTWPNPLQSVWASLQSSEHHSRHRWCG